MESDEELKLDLIDHWGHDLDFRREWQSYMGANGRAHRAYVLDITRERRLERRYARRRGA